MASRAISRSCLHLASPSPATRVFLNLAAQHISQRGNFSTSTAVSSSTSSYNSIPPLEFLTPSIPIYAVPQSRHPRPSLLHAPIPQALPWQSAATTTTSLASSTASARSFSSSARRSQAVTGTAAIWNPQKDEDGADMVLDITPRAANRLAEIMAKDSNPNLALRIQVESGGCHGFQYIMSLTTLPELVADKVAGKALEDSQLGEDDTVFEALGGSGARVVMDGPSLELLKGSKVDFTMELIGSQFKIVDNPLATSSCGCGTSFDIKF